MDPADAEADSRGTKPVGERHERGLPAAGDDDPVHLDAVDELLEDRLARRRLGDRLVEIALELGAALDAEDRPLASGVDRLEDGREPTASSAASMSASERSAAYGGCGSPAAPSASRIASLCVRR